MTPLTAADHAFATCADQAWTRAQQAMTPEELASHPMPSASAIRKACKEEIAAWERAFAKNIAADVERRTALFEKAKARLKRRP